MKKHTLAFSTFLKLLELSDDKKRTMLKGFTRKGGYNYWFPLQNLAEDVASNNLVGGDISNRVGQMCKSHQQKYNDLALLKLSMWFERRKAKVIQKPDKIEKKFTNSGLSVKLNPEVAFEMGGVKYMMHVWATNTPALSEQTLSAGLNFFQHHFRQSGYEDYQYMIYDTTKDNVFGEFNILQNAGLVLSDQRNVIHDLWHEVWNENDLGKQDGIQLPADSPGLN